MPEKTFFSLLVEACEALEEWQEDYDYKRPHSALSNLAPMEFAGEMSMDKLAI